MSIRVMIVDDHTIVRRGLTTFLSVIPDFDLVAEAANGEEAFKLCASSQPDVILMDMVMPRGMGVPAIRAIKEAYPHIQIIGLTSFVNDKDLLLNALEAGATGYVFKDVSIQDLEAAIRAAYDGVAILSPEATRMLIQARKAPPLPNFPLSPRELDVLALMSKGQNNTEIADTLGISRSTVKFHVSSILSKLNVDSRTEAVSMAHQYNLLST